LYNSSTRFISASIARFWASSWSHKALTSVVVVGDVVGGAVGRVDSGAAVVGGGWVATGAETGGGAAAVVTGVVVGSALDGGATEVGRVVAGAESARGGPVGSDRGVTVAVGVEAGSPVVVELGTMTSANTVAGSVVVDASSSWRAVVGTTDVDVADTVVTFVIVRAVVVAAVASDLGMGVGPSPEPPELGPCHTAARTKRTTSSTVTTTRANVLRDGRSSAF
jgi:hypothetical protein